MTGAVVVPGYWMNETTGVLRPAVQAYLEGAELSREQVGAMRAYFRQWMNGSWQGGDELAKLRSDIDTLTNRADIKKWLEDALALGIDPL